MTETHSSFVQNISQVIVTHHRRQHEELLVKLTSRCAVAGLRIIGNARSAYITSSPLVTAKRVHEIRTQDRPEKYVNICSDSQAALKALQAVTTTSPLVRQFQQALNDISARHAVALFWVPGQTGVTGNEIADKLARDGSAQRFVGPEPVLGVSRQNIRRKMKSWIENKHVALWRGPCSTQRQARELISGPDLAMWARLLSFNRTQTRVVIGLLTGHNTLRRHLHIMGLCNDPMCKKWGTEEETSVHILCECEALASLRHTHLGSFLLNPEDIRELGVGAIWNFAKGTGLL
jgi:hypothetical protein